MSAQISYSINQPVAYAGLVYAQAPSDIISRSVETVAGIPFGVVVSRGTDADTQALLGGALVDFLGITIRSLDREGAANTGDVQYSETETAGIMRYGYVWALCPTGCVPGDTVNYTIATGVLDSGTAAGGEAQVAGAQWDTTSAAGELGVIRILA
jgi:hypothetical protein